LEEGFDEVRPVVSETGYVLIDEVAAGSIDLAYMFIPELVHAIDHDVPIVILGPAHSACNKVVAADYVADLADLRGRRVGIAPLRVPQPGDFAFATSVLQRIGITPPTEVELVPVKRNDMLTVLGKDVDALFTFSPVSFSVLDSGQGHVIFDSSTDDPWSRQLCCALFAPRQFVEANPGATRKAVRAVLRALNRGASDPAAMSEAMVAKSWVVTEDYASRAVAELSFGAWRTHDLADSMRFYGLSLHEAGLISSTPEEIIQRGTDLAFFNELKEELAYAPGGVDSRFSFYCDPSENRAVTRAAGLATARRAT
jgi:NitT/TauT family transport system substrate-binding protein